MKKTAKFLLIFFLAINTQGQIKTAIITYKKTHTKKIFTSDKKEKIGKDKFYRFAAVEAESHNLANTLTFKLFYSDNQTLFKADEVMDSPNYRYKKMALLPFGIGIYFNSLTKRIHSLNSFGEDFLVEYPLNYTNWTLLKETKRIGNYIAYKAVAEEKVKLRDGSFKTYKIIAWYTPKLNIQFGPIGYSGLPGLIIELSKNNVTYYTNNIQLNPKEKVDVKILNKGKKITLKEFKKMTENAMGDYRKIRG